MLSLYFCNQFEMTALHYACQNGHDKIVQVLMGGGADVNAKDDVRFFSFLCVGGEVGNCEIGIV